VSMSRIFNQRGEMVGEVKGQTYETVRDYERGQIFISPKFGDAVAVDCDILRQLNAAGVQTIRMLIRNFDVLPFWIELSLLEFLEKSVRILHDKKISHLGIDTRYSEQRMLSIHKWRRGNGSGF